MRRDVDRTELPGGSAYNMVDFIPDEIQAVTGGRGGWTYAGPALTGTPTQLTNIGYHPDLDKVIVTDDVSLWDAVAGGAVLGTPTGHVGVGGYPAYHRGSLFFGSALKTGIWQQPTAIQNDGTITTLATSPIATIPGVYKDHALLARAGTTSKASPSVHLNRIWFSAAGDPTTWDTSFGWWDTTGDIVGLASLLNCILIFHAGSTERLRGTTPPPGSDMTLEPFLPNVGCLDPFSIAYWQNNAIFASSQGVFMTNGASSVDLTASAQLKTYWQSLMSGYTAAWRVSGGVYRDHYILSISNSTTMIDCLCFSLQTQAAWRFTNLSGAGFVNVQSAKQEKLYMAQWSAGRVAELSTLWSPSSTVKQDGDGTNPTPIIETGMFRGWDRLNRRYIESMGLQKWRFAYVDHDLRDAASDNPTAALSYCTTPAGSYTQAGLTLPETTAISRVRRSLSPTQGGATRSQMLGMKYAVTGPYSLANLYTLEGSFEPIEIGAL